MSYHPPVTEERLEELKAQVRGSPDVPELRYELCAAYWETNDVVVAESCYHEMLSNGEFFPALVDLAQVQLHRGRFVQASETLTNLLHYGSLHGSLPIALERWSEYWLQLTKDAEPLTELPRSSLPEAVSRVFVNSINMEFIEIPSGEFVMGRDDGPPNERPAHLVTMGSYWIGAFEVTREQYAQFLKDTHYEPDGGPLVSANGGRKPVSSVSWRDAIAFTIWLSIREKSTYRLPTEAEWEYAARGTDGRTNPWGMDRGEASKHGNWGRLTVRSAASHGRLADIGVYPAGVSFFGLYDMAGNVSEWCLDSYAARYYEIASTTNPFGPMPVGSVAFRKSLRGGGWRTSLEDGWATFRSFADSNLPYDHFGFRVIREK